MPLASSAKRREARMSINGDVTISIDSVGVGGVLVTRHREADAVTKEGCRLSRGFLIAAITGGERPALLRAAKMK